MVKSTMIAIPQEQRLRRSINACRVLISILFDMAKLVKQLEPGMTVSNEWCIQRDTLVAEIKVGISR